LDKIKIHFLEEWYRSASLLPSKVIIILEKISLMQQLAFDHRVAGKYETFILIWIKTIILLKRAFPQNKIIGRRMNGVLDCIRSFYLDSFIVLCTCNSNASCVGGRDSTGLCFFVNSILRHSLTSVQGFVRSYSYNKSLNHFEIFFF